MTDGGDTLVQWHAWSADAFARAERQGSPVLLALTAPWCEWCHRMDDESYGDPRIAARIEEAFVPIRVDVDRRPRIRERYNMGGFPSTVFLTPDGEVVSGATYLGPDGLRQVLASVRQTWDAKGAEAGRIPRALRDDEPPGGTVTDRIEAWMLEQVAAAFDEEYGGWGAGPKFPLARTVEFAAKRDRDRATRTLEAIRTHLRDTYGGGFYRFAETRDWGEPHREKLCDENAAIVRAFTTGYLYTGEESYRETAAGGIDYLTTTLWTGDAFAASQAGGDYYTLEAADREAADPPSIDETEFADRNGLAADALLRYTAVTDDDAAARYAERALAHVTTELLEDGTVTHYAAAESPTGLLVDHARLLAGLTTAAQVLGPEGYLDDAKAVADDAIDRLRTDTGAFIDGPAAGPGLLSWPLRPLEQNAELADALIDLWALSGADRYQDVARAALSAFADAADRMGVEAGGYASACARVVHEPLVVRTPLAGSTLHRAALRVADHEKVVVPTERDDAVVVHDGEETAPAGTPDELIERVTDRVETR